MHVYFIWVLHACDQQAVFMQLDSVSCVSKAHRQGHVLITDIIHESEVTNTSSLSWRYLHQNELQILGN